MKRFKMGAAALLVGIGCGGASEPVAVANRVVASPADIVLAIGDEVRVDSLLRVGFMSVPGDSRCPTTVVCIWMGDGAAEISYGIGMGPSTLDTLHTALGRSQATFRRYTITLLDLMPYPTLPGTIPPDQYAVRLRIVRR